MRSRTSITSIDMIVYTINESEIVQRRIVTFVRNTYFTNRLKWDGVCTFRPGGYEVSRTAGKSALEFGRKQWVVFPTKLTLGRIELLSRTEWKGSHADRCKGILNERGGQNKCKERTQGRPFENRGPRRTHIVASPFIAIGQLVISWWDHGYMRLHACLSQNSYHGIVEMY